MTMGFAIRTEIDQVEFRDRATRRVALSACYRKLLWGKTVWLC